MTTAVRQQLEQLISVAIEEFSDGLWQPEDIVERAKKLLADMEGSEMIVVKIQEGDVT